MIDQKKIQTMCHWVQERVSDELVGTYAMGELQQTFTTLATVAEDAQSTFLIPDLFPGIKLNVLYIHNVEGSPKKSALLSTATTWTPGLSAHALSAIGEAVSKELQAKGCDMLSCAMDGAEIILFEPQVQPLVLQATGTTLLTQLQ